MATTNTLLLLAGLLLMFSVMVSAVSARLGLPLLLVFLGVGMLAGEDGPGGIRFDDFATSFLIGNLALAIILLDGGLRTNLASFRVGLWPAVTLATWGVAATAGLLGLFTTWLLDVDWRYGLLLGAIVGSTDAAAVFALLRQSGVRLNERVKATLEIESGANDPMAVFLVILLVEALTVSEPATVGGLALRLVEQFGLGALAGILGGWLLSVLMRKLHLAEGLYAILIASGGLVVFASTNHLGGSGFLAIYLAGLIVGNRRSHATEHALKVMDGLAWLAQAGMFLILGLLVTPSQMVDHLWQALAIALFLVLIARPLAVFTALLLFQFPARETGFVAWVGLRGAVPIILAVFPVVAGVSESRLLFDITFTVVLFSLLIQGTSIPIAARWLKMVVPRQAEPLDRRELWQENEHSLELMQFRVEAGSAADGRDCGDLPVLLHGAEPRTILVVRDAHAFYASSGHPFTPGDRVWLLAPSEGVDRLSDFFSAEARDGSLAAHTFFGEFVLDAQAKAGELAAAYGLAVTGEEAEKPLASLLRQRLGRPLVVGDRIALNGLQLTVREIENSMVTKVGLKLASSR